MNKKFLFPFLGLVLGVFTTGFVQSCIDDGNNDDDNIVVCPAEGMIYKGQLKVEQPLFEDDDVMVTFFRSSDVLVGKLVMFDVKFAERMPRLPAMTIDGISVTAPADSLRLTGEGIEPMVGDTPYPQYIMTDLQGVVTQDSLIVSMKSGSMPLSFRGKRQ